MSPKNTNPNDEAPATAGAPSASAQAATLKTAERIRTARAAAGWSQKQLADATGIPQADISRYERGKKNPGGVTVDRIMTALRNAGAGAAAHVLDAVDGVLGIQGRAAGKLLMVDPTEKPIPVEWIVEGFVARGFLTMIAGEPGAGKSYTTQTIGVGLVQGHDKAAGMKLHHRYVERPCTDEACDYLAKRDPRVDSAAHNHRELDSRVLVLDAENGPNLIQQRVQDIGLHPTEAARYVTAASDGFDLYKDRAVLEGVLADYSNAGTPIDLVILDSWTSLWFGNENVVEQVQLSLKALNETASRHGVGILLIHHTDKEGETYRGSSAIAGTISGGVFTFARVDEKIDVPQARVITCKKLRIAPEPAPLRVYVTGHGISDERPDVLDGFDVDGIAKSVRDQLDDSDLDTGD